MSNLISRVTGNWLTAGTWGLVDTTSYLNSETGASTCPTSGGASARSTAFTPGAITIDGIAVKLANRTGTTGTMTVELWNNTGSAVVAATTVTINTADLPAAVTASADGGWIVFGFASVLLLAATDYMVQCTTSTASMIDLFRDSTANNWSRMLRTTTTQAPAASDDLVVSGDFTGAGTSNSFTVTMNSTTATDYGSNSTSNVIPALAVCNKGTLLNGTTVATNYILRLSGHLIVYQIGVLNIGTTGTPIPRDSTAVLEFDCAADGDFGLIARNGSTVNMQGLSRTSGKNIVSCKLNTDEAVAQTVLGVDTDTGWLSGDQIAIAPTTQTQTESELRTLSANANASDMTVTAGLTNAHSGTSPTQAEVINITRNVKVRAVTSTLVSFVNYIGTSTVDVDWVEHSALGENVAGKRGIELSTTTGSFSMQFSSLYDCEDYGFYATHANLNNVDFSSNVLWNCCSVSGDSVVRISQTTGQSITVSSNIAIQSGSFAIGFLFLDAGNIYTNNTAAGMSDAGFSVNEFGGIIGTCSGNSAHSCFGGGSSFQGIRSGLISNTTLWRNQSKGMTIQRNETIIFDGLICFANVGLNIDFSDTVFQFVTMKNSNFNSDSTFTTTYGLQWTTSPPAIFLLLDNCTFSVPSGIKTAHGSADIAIQLQFNGHILLRNTILAKATEFETPGNMNESASISSERHDQIAGNHKTWLRYGTLSTDTTIFNTASPSMRMTPLSATGKLESAALFQGMKVAVNNGGTVTINVRTRRSSAGDGAAYNGAQPRLIVKANPALGSNFNSDTVLDTYTAADGTWEQLTGTTASTTDAGAVECVVDADGTAGWINCDDWSVS